MLFLLNTEYTYIFGQCREIDICIHLSGTTLHPQHFKAKHIITKREVQEMWVFQKIKVIQWRHLVLRSFLLYLARPITKCPATHPYAYDRGRYCCRNNYLNEHCGKGEKAKLLFTHDSSCCDVADRFNRDCFNFNCRLDDYNSGKDIMK